MYLGSVDNVAGGAVKRSEFLKKSPIGFWISAMMAGAYVGLGIILIFSVGSDADPAYRALIMGCSFGIALTLVVFAGSDLFTGHTMFMPMGLLRGRVGWGDLASVGVMSWPGNLVGAGLLAALLVAGGGGAALASKSGFLLTVAAAKMSAPPLALFARAILCNWLVCLAVWCSFRTTSDVAKLILVFWCLFAFIGAGFEHSIANMTLLTLGLLLPHDPALVSWAGFARNLLVVTAGNVVGGAVFIESEVDHPVQRDPSSAAPEYPPFLEEERIEGAVVVQYVVDTTGSADSTSLVVDESTNPAFAESVRDALPHMRFQPAEFQGRRVRQLVRQEFRFVMPDAGDTNQTTRTTSSSAPPRAARHTS